MIIVATLEQSKLAGIKDGNPKCKCRFNFKKTGKDSNNKIICQAIDVTCKPSEVTRGFDKFGTPICTTMKTVCATINLGDKSAGCPNSGWIEAIDLGVCKAPKSNKKGDSEGVVKCKKNEAKCCWREVIK